MDPKYLPIARRVMTRVCHLPAPARRGMIRELGLTGVVLSPDRADSYVVSRYVATFGGATRSDAWSDEARAAALEARQASAKAKGASAKAQVAKTSEQAHKFASKAADHAEQARAAATRASEAASKDVAQAQSEGRMSGAPEHGGRALESARSAEESAKTALRSAQGLRRQEQAPINLPPHDEFRDYPVVKETSGQLHVQVGAHTIGIPARREGGDVPAHHVSARISPNRGPEGGSNVQISHVSYVNGKSSGYSGQIFTAHKA